MLFCDNWKTSFDLFIWHTTRIGRNYKQSRLVYFVLSLQKMKMSSVKSSGDLKAEEGGPYRGFGL